VVDYRNAIKRFDGAGYSFTSLEGYVAARLFVDALEKTVPCLAGEDFVHTLDTQIKNHDPGLGTQLNFSSTNHQASHTVGGSVLNEDGTFSMPFIWTPETRISAGIN
jgi:hypothetical protein